MTIKGLKINYKTLGEGRPLLILHGWGSSSEKWQKIGELLAQKGVKVIIPDLPGFGKSEEPQKAWNLDQYCDFVEEFIKILNLDKFYPVRDSRGNKKAQNKDISNGVYLLGHSFGGSLAVKFSLQHPEKVAKLFLVSAACIRKKSLKNKLFKFISRFFKIKPLFLRKFFYRKSDYLSVKSVMKETYLKVIEEDLSDVLEKVKVPTMIIWGAKDKITPIKQAKLIKTKIRNSELKIIPNIGHSPHLEAPEKLGDRVSQELL